MDKSVAKNNSCLSPSLKKIQRKNTNKDATAFNRLSLNKMLINKTTMSYDCHTWRSKEHKLNAIKLDF